MQRQGMLFHEIAYLCSIFVLEYQYHSQELSMRNTLQKTMFVVLVFAIP
jgi:hypothetical protein